MQHLARGGRKEILTARYAAMGLEVALATISAESEPAVVHSFVREARLTAAAQAPGIVPILDLGVLPDGRPSFPMPWLQGRALTKYLTDPPTLALRDAFVLFRHVLEILSVAHQRDVVHLDVSPENILVQTSGYPLVLDWGLARLPHLGS